MPVSVNDLWGLLVRSQLLSAEACGQWAGAFSHLKGASQTGNAATLAEWLVSQRVISKYQAKVLLAGHAGPFRYGDYQVYDRIESGRLKGVFRAVHLPTGHAVCLCFFTGAATQDAQRWARVVQQAAWASQFQSSFVARCYELVDTGQYKFAVLENLQGESVQELLAGGPLPAGEACRLARQAAQGLAELFQHGEVHGEVRPANLWLDLAGNVRWLHFPLWRDPTAGPSTATSSDGRLNAIADYLAPELAAGTQPPSHLSDIYGLGCSLYHMLSGRVPFDGGDMQQKLARHTTEPPPDLRQLNPSVSPPVARIVGYLMDKNPAARYQHAANVVQALAPYLDGLPDAPREPVTEAAQAYENYLQWRRAGRAPGAAAPVGAPVATAAAAVAAPGVAAAVAQPGIAAPMVAPAVAAPIGPPAMTAPVASPGVGAPTGPGGMAAPVAAAAGGAPMASPLGPAAVSAALATPSPQLVPAAVTAGDPIAPAGVTPALAQAMMPLAAPAAQGVASAPGLATAPAAGTPVPGVPKIGELQARPAAAAAVLARRRSSRKNLAVIITAGLIAAAALVLTFGIDWGQKPDAAQVSSGNGESGRPAAGGGKGVITPVVKNPNGTATGQPNGSGGSGSGTSGATTNGSAGSAPSRPLETFKPVGGSLDGFWVSPTSGPPLDFRYTLSGAQVLIVLRPAEMAASPEGKAALETAGPLGPWLQSQVQRMTGLQFADLEQVTIGLIASAPGKPPLACVVGRATTDIDPAALRDALGKPEAAKIAGQSVLANDELAWYLPPDDQRLVVVTPAEKLPGADVLPIQEAISHAQAAPPLRREIEALAMVSDQRRHVNILFAPNFLFTGAKNIWQGLLEPLQKPAEAFLGDHGRAGLVSLHFGEEAFFVEMRYHGDADIAPLELATHIQDRFNTLPKQIEDYVFSINISPYSRKILTYFPRMLGALGDQLSVATSDQHVVLRAYLPPYAASNLALGTYLALVERPGVPAVAVNTGTAPPPVQEKPPETAAEILAKKTMSLSFPRDTLEQTMKLLSEEIGIEIRILGEDLQLEGITKNQSFGLDERNKTAGEILRTVMLKARPDGKLIYVIKKDGEKEIIFITTRTAAEKRGDKLPPELEIKKEAKKE